MIAVKCNFYQFHNIIVTSNLWQADIYFIIILLRLFLLFTFYFLLFTFYFLLWSKMSYWSALFIPNSSQSTQHCRNSSSQILNGFETHLLRDSRMSMVNRSSSRILSSSLKILWCYQQPYSRIRKIYPGRCGILASSAVSPEAQTFSCNNHDHHKAVPCCAPFRDQKVEGRSSYIEAIDIQSIQIILHATEVQVYVLCDSKDESILRRR